MFSSTLHPNLFQLFQPIGGVWAKSASGFFGSGALQEMIKITRQMKHNNKLNFVVVFDLIFNPLLLFFKNVFTLLQTQYEFTLY
jgi:hypothetical protein